MLPLALLGAFLAAPGCHERHHEKHEAGKLAVSRPLRTDADLTRDYVAQVRAIQHIEVRALARGYLQEVFVDEGQRISKGTKIFQIMPAIYQAELAKANAEAELAQIELENTMLLADKSIVSPNELALARARYDGAKAEVTLKATHRSLTEVRAPFDGIVGRFQVRVGSLIDEGELLTTLSDNGSMWVYFNVSEAEYLAYRARPEGDTPTAVKLVMANGREFDQAGRVETIEADFNNETGAIAFRATFPNPKGLLRHGQTGKVVMTSRVENALVIPQKATFDVLDKKFVYVVDEKNVVRSRAITVAAERPLVCAIESGLDERDRILIEGLRKVHDGQTIDIDLLDPAKVLATLEVPSE